jgi:hypothetical protein
MRAGSEPVIQMETDALWSAMGTDEAGRLYIVTVNAGEVYRIDPG